MTWPGISAFSTLSALAGAAAKRTIPETSVSIISRESRTVPASLVHIDRNDVKDRAGG